MKLISLNLWGGRAGMPGLLEFLKKHQDVDIFCFQEMWHGGEGRDVFGALDVDDVEFQLCQKIQEVLPDHISYFRPIYFDFYGLTIFVKKNIRVLSDGEFFVYREKGWFSKENIADHARSIQYINIDTEKGPRTIVNFHGLWNGKGKDDTEDRLLQSENIVQFLKEVKDPLILCGDFNLVPESESILKLERFGLRNLIRENDVTSTRTSLYSKPIRFTDYTFVSEGVVVEKFQVLPDEVSDHSAMYLDFE